VRLAGSRLRTRFASGLPPGALPALSGVEIDAMRDKSQRIINRLGDHAKAMAALIEGLASRRRTHTVFTDFCELSALSISNAVDWAQRDAREARYRQIAKGYSAQEMAAFPKLLAHLIGWLSGGLDDCLGRLYMLLELGNDRTGQYFTPFDVSRAVAAILVGNVQAQVEREGFVTVCEPAVGSGGMVIALADEIARQGVNYQRAMHVTATDVDAAAVHMAFVQLSLLHVPAIVLHGNSLSQETWGHWVTPAHVVHGWDRRLQRRFEASESGVDGAGAAASPATPVPDLGGGTAGGLADARERVVGQRLAQLRLIE